MKKFIYVVFSLIILFIVGCSNVRIEYEKPIVKIVNNSNKTVDIYLKICGEDSTTYIKNKEKLYPSSRADYNSDRMSTHVLNLSVAGCYDIQAIDSSDGSIIGKQTGVRVPPEMLWVLK